MGWLKPKNHLTLLSLSVHPPPFTSARRALVMEEDGATIRM